MKKTHVMRGHLIVLISAVALAKADTVRKNRNGCPVDVTAVDDILVPHKECSKYYQCVNGQLVSKNCPSDLFFNSEALLCDMPGNVNCIRDVQIIQPIHTEDQSDPKQAPRICSAKESNGILVAHEHCNQFYQCWDEVPVALSCFGNLLYNPFLEICDWPDQVDCGTRVIPESSDNENSDSNETPTICATEGSEDLILAHQTCNKFYRCHEGKPIAFKCPGHLLFNPTAGYCDCADNVICGDRDINEGNDSSGNNSDSEENSNSNVNDDPKEAPKICAPEGSSGILVAHEICNKFYKCDHGKPIEFTCYGELLFNPFKEHCDWAENVDCGERIIPENESEEGITGDSDNEGPEDNGSDNSGSGNGDTNNNGNNGNGHDDPSLAPAICAADKSEGILVAHAKCNKFFVCVGGKPVAMSCPGNLLFNPETDECDWPEKVKCGNSDDGSTEDGSSENGGSDNGDNGDTDNNGNSGNGHDDPSLAPAICAADKSEGILVAHAKCNKFFVCVGGKPVAMSCPGNLLFNPETDECDWPEKVKCGDRIIPEESEEEDNTGGSDDGSTEAGSCENGGSDNGDNGDSDNNGNSGNGHDDPSLAPAICAADKSVGILIAHAKCNKFFVCVGGKPVAMSCPGNLLFNPETDECDWPEKVKCGDRIIPEESEEEDNTGGSDDGSTEAGSSENGGSDNGDNGDSDNNGNSGNGHDDPSLAPAICAADKSEGILVAHTKCNKFFVCVGGKPVAMSCPGNLLFNPETDECDWPEKVKCGDRIIPEESEEEDNTGGSEDGSTEAGSSENGGSDNGDNGDSDNNGNIGNGYDDPSLAPAICAADKSEGILVAHAKCNKFFVCVGGKPVAMSCPGNLLFNPETDECDWPEKVKCGDRIIPEESEEEDNTGGSDDGSTEAGSSENGGSDNGDNGDSDNNGNSGNGHDDPSLAPAICAADKSEGILVAHAKCNKFFVCVGGKPVAMSCPGNLLFNPETDECDWPEKVKCGDRIIPEESEEEDNTGGSEDGSTEAGSSENGGSDNGDNGDSDNNGNIGNGYDDPSLAPAICAADKSEGILVAHAKCNKFFVCVGGKPVAMSCPGNLLFNPETDECDWPEKVKCGDRIIPEESEEEDNTGGSDDGSTEAGSCENGGSDNGDNGDSDNNGNSGNGHDDPSLAPAICAADKSEGILVAHAKCNKFFVCVGGKPVAMSCPGSLLFNPGTGECDLSQNVKCGDRIIPENSEEEDNIGGSDNGDVEDGGSVNGGPDSGGNEDTDNNGNSGNSHDNPSLAPTICAADHSEGVLVAHENCNQFYVCIGGTPVTVNCPKYLLYNPSVGKCDWSENVICSDRLVPEKSSEEDYTGDSGNNSTEDGNSDNGGDGDNGESENNGNSNNGHDDPSLAPAICAANGSEGIFVAHEHCNQFYICLGSKPVTLDCPDNFLYNPSTEICDRPNNVNCGDRDIPGSAEENGEDDANDGSDGNGGSDGNSGSNGNEDNDINDVATTCASINDSEGIFIAHENCHQFYVCIDGLAVALDCPLGLMYDLITTQCDWPENVNCTGRLVEEHEIDDNNSESAENSDPESGDNDDNNGGSDESDENDDDPIENDTFDKHYEAAVITCAFDGSAGLALPHADCNKFYVCLQGKPTLLQCAADLLFDIQRKQCYWPENVDCGNRGRTLLMSFNKHFEGRQALRNQL